MEYQRQLHLMEQIKEQDLLSFFKLSHAFPIVIFLLPQF